MSSGEAAAAIVGATATLGVPVILICMSLYQETMEKRYMREQRQTGRDKQRLSDFMQIVMKEYYNDYTYAVGNNKIPVGRYLVNYYSYILCFNESDIVVLSYVMQDGALICRNALPIDWSCTRLKYCVRDKGVKLIFQMGKTKMRIYVDRAVVSDGSEKLDTPLGLVQNEEVDRLIAYLPYYTKRNIGKL